MASAIGTALFCSVLQPMVAKAKNIIKDKGLETVGSMADKAMDISTDKGLEIGKHIANKAVDKEIVNIERDISKLQKTLRMIESIVRVAEVKKIDDDDFIQNWLRDLVDIGYEARDVLDDFITFSSCIIKAEKASNQVNFISSFMPSYFDGSSSDTSNIPLATLNRLGKDIRSVRERFDEKKMEGDTFATLKSVVGEGSESVKTRKPVGPFINKQRDGLFLGREDVKKGIMDKILHPSDDRVDVVVIWGMGGIGKTTLAQSIYNDESVKNVPRRWLCVGESKFCAEKVIREIVNDKKTIGIVNLQTTLQKELSGDRFLIVLDDVWDIDGSEWDLLFNPLTEVGKGGLIIITRRERDLCAAITIQMAYNLEPLSEEDSWLIFESCAYVNGKSDSTPDLKHIGEEIVKKLNGLPLALKVVGRSLLNKDSSTWTDFLESKFSEDDEVMSALRWSYNHLPPHLKMCFTYCSLFPKDHVFDNEKVLVEMWMTHDLIKTEKQKRPEDVGAHYFEQLVNASLLQWVDGKYTMHDLIRDLAVLVSNGEFASTINSSLTNDQMETVRHITITPGDYSKIPRLCKIEKLLTLYTTDTHTTDDEIYPTEKYVLDVFNQLKSIRVLVLVSSKITDIPDCISELSHLRYLDVSRTRVKSLPNSLCHLYNLQMIAAPHLFNVELPIDIVNISSLRYVRASLSTCKGVGKLTSLQELSSIHVSKDDNIRELGDMKRLRGKLSIEGLGNVTTLEGDGGALMEKQTLMDELELTFHLEKSNISAQVLDALGCPPNLTYLRIADYNGLKSPNWMVDRKHKFDKLQTLELSNCPKLESLPPLGELTSLKHLSLLKVGVKILGDEFYGKFTDSKVFFLSLESLHFSDMFRWKKWDHIIIKNSSRSFFPRLTSLELKNCSKLESLPPLGELTSLKRLSLLNVGVKRLGDEFYGKFTNDKVFFPSLESLVFSHMREWEEWDDIIIENSSVPFFSRLTTLELSFCPKLESLPPLGELTSLKHLSLLNVGVRRLGDEFYGKFTDGKVFFPSLESLAFDSMWGWEEWDDISIENSSVSFFPRLTTLELSNCPKLESLPPLGELTSLKHIFLWNVGVKRLGEEFYGKFTEVKDFFPSLESLRFDDMKEWDGWDDIIIENSNVSFFSRLTTLELSNCPELESLPPLGELTSLKHLSLESVGVKRLGDEFYGRFTDGKVFFPSLELLHFCYMEEWEEWDDIIIGNYSMSFFPRLTELNIRYCEKLVSVLPVVKNPIMNAANFMTSLSRLKICNCDGLKRLQLDAFVSLKVLDISDCKSLVQITSALCESLKISSCRLLEKMDVARCDSLQVVIKSLQLEGCESLRSLSIDIHGLDSLDIRGCLTLELAFEDGSSSSSSSGNSVAVPIHRITTDNMQVLRTLLHHELVSLESLDITNLGGFENFDETEALNIYNFCKSRSLKSLRISQCEDLKSLPADFHKLSSLERLYIYDCAQLQSLHPDFHKLPSLEELWIYDCPQLQSLPPDFLKLSSLKRLLINDCPQLQSFPANGLPPSLRFLRIIGCPLLYERCKDESGFDWHKINHIRDILIRQHNQRVNLNSMTMLELSHCP